MAKVVTIHQPNYLPWIGLFSKVARAEELIIYDTARYSRGSFVRLDHPAMQGQTHADPKGGNWHEH